MTVGELWAKDGKTTEVVTAAQFDWYSRRVKRNGGRIVLSAPLTKDGCPAYSVTVEWPS